MPTETVKFVKSPDFTASVAAGAMLAGPTADGFVHVSFFREVQYPIDQEVEVSELPPPDASLPSLPANATQAQRRSDAKPPRLVAEKELVATISLPMAAVAPLGAALQQLAEFAQGKPAQQGKPTGG